MRISLSELVENPERYIEILDKEDILITKNDRNIAKLTGFNKSKGIAESLFGILPANVDLDKARTDRLIR